MTIPNLTREKIEKHTAGGSFKRGEEYLADGAVVGLKRSDEHTLKAQVQGSDVHPYLVTVKFDEADIRSVKCTCPYFEGSWCKHIVAALLKTLEEDEVPVDQGVEVRELLRDLDREGLITLLEGLVDRRPELLDHIRDEYARMTQNE